MKNIELEFILERERRYLLKNPFKGIDLAIAYLEDYLHLSREFKVLEQKYQSAIADNQRLTSQIIDMYCLSPEISPSIASRSVLN